MCYNVHKNNKEIIGALQINLFILRITKIYRYFYSPYQTEKICRYIFRYIVRKMPGVEKNDSSTEEGCAQQNIKGDRRYDQLHKKSKNQIKALYSHRRCADWHARYRRYVVLSDGPDERHDR